MEILKFTANDEIPLYLLNQLNTDFDLWLDREECSFSLQYEKLFLAVKNAKVVGFQSINDSCECLVIEVATNFRGQGVSFQLIEASGGIVPYELSNDNPSFWEKVSEVYGG